MMSKGSKSLSAQELANIAPIRLSQDRCLDLMGMISDHLSLASQGYKDLKFHAGLLFDALPTLSAKPSKKRPRSAKPRTSIRRKALS